VRTRQSPGYPAGKPAAGADQTEMVLDEEGRQALRETLAYLKPHLKA
jgi:hypothetical protein